MPKHSMRLEQNNIRRAISHFKHHDLSSDVYKGDCIKKVKEYRMKLYYGRIYFHFFEPMYPYDKVKKKYRIYFSFSTIEFHSLAVCSYCKLNPKCTCYINNWWCIQVEDSWKSTEFTVLAHRDSKDVFILGGTDDIQVLLDDSQVNISTIAGSRHVGPIKPKVEEWSRQLSLFSETLVM